MHLVDLERVRVSNRLWLLNDAKVGTGSRGRFAPTRLYKIGDTYRRESGLNGSVRQKESVVVKCGDVVCRRLLRRKFQGRKLDRLVS